MASWISILKYSCIAAVIPFALFVVGVAAVPLVLLGLASFALVSLITALGILLLVLNSPIIVGAAVLYYILACAERPQVSYQGTHRIPRMLLAYCPLLRGDAKYYPTFWLSNGHIQTLIARYLWKASPQLKYRRELVASGLDDSLAIDWVISPTAKVGSPASLPHATIVLINSECLDGQLRGILAGLAYAFAENNYQCAILHLRGYSGQPLQKAKNFAHAGDTDDIRSGLEHISSARLRCGEISSTSANPCPIVQSDTPMIAIAMHLGANRLVRYLSEEGHRAPLAGAVALSNPWDLVQREADVAVSADPVKPLLWQRVLARSMVEFVRQHRNAVASTGAVDIELALASRTLRQADDRIVRAANGYASVDDYYVAAGSRAALIGVKIPLLIVNSYDDPLVSPAVVKETTTKCRDMPYVVMVTTRHGGHAAFLEGAVPVHLRRLWQAWRSGGNVAPLAIKSWLERAVLEWAGAVCRFTEISGGVHRKRKGRTQLRRSRQSVEDEVVANGNAEQCDDVRSRAENETRSTKPSAKMNQETQRKDVHQPKGDEQAAGVSVGG